MSVLQMHSLASRKRPTVSFRDERPQKYTHLPCDSQLFHDVLVAAMTRNLSDLDDEDLRKRVLPNLAAAFTSCPLLLGNCPGGGGGVVYATNSCCIDVFVVAGSAQAKATVLCNLDAFMKRSVSPLILVPASDTTQSNQKYVFDVRYRCIGPTGGLTTIKLLTVNVSFEQHDSMQDVVRTLGPRRRAAFDGQTLF